MSTLGISIALAYLASAFQCWVCVYRWCYREHMRHYSMLGWRPGDRAFGILWGGTVALFWPIFVPAALLIWLAMHAPRSLFARLEREAA